MLLLALALQALTESELLMKSVCLAGDCSQGAAVDPYTTTNAEGNPCQLMQPSGSYGNTKLMRLRCGPTPPSAPPIPPIPPGGYSPPPGPPSHHQQAQTLGRDRDPGGDLPVQNIRVLRGLCEDDLS